MRCASIPSAPPQRLEASRTGCPLAHQSERPQVGFGLGAAGERAGIWPTKRKELIPVGKCGFDPLSPARPLRPEGAFGIEVAFTRAGVMLALLFVTLPFVVRAVQPVLHELDPEVEEARRRSGPAARPSSAASCCPACDPRSSPGRRSPSPARSASSGRSCSSRAGTSCSYAPTRRSPSPPREPTQHVPPWPREQRSTRLRFASG